MLGVLPGVERHERIGGEEGEEGAARAGDGVERGVGVGLHATAVNVRDDPAMARTDDGPVRYAGAAGLINARSRESTTSRDERGGGGTGSGVSRGGRGAHLFSALLDSMMLYAGGASNVSEGARSMRPSQ